MTTHKDLTPPMGNGNPFDAALILSHKGRIASANNAKAAAAADLRAAKAKAKEDGVPLDIIELVEKRAKYTDQANVDWFNSIIAGGQVLRVPGLMRIQFVAPLPAENFDEEAILRERYETGLFHGRQGLSVDVDLFDAATAAGQEYKRGYDIGRDEYRRVMAMGPIVDEPPQADEPKAAEPKEKPPEAVVDAAAEEKPKRGRAAGSKNRHPRIDAVKKQKAQEAVAVDPEPMDVPVDEVDIDVDAELDALSNFGLPPTLTTADLPPMPGAKREAVAA